MSAACCSPAGARATRTAGRATCSTASTTGSGACGATAASAATVGGEQHQFRAGLLPLQARRLAVWSSSARRTTTPGAWASAKRAASSARRPTATRASTCRSPIATTKRSAAGRPSQLASIADTHLFQPVTDKVRQVDHHGGYTAAAGHALYTARTYPQAVLEPRGVRLRADRATWSARSCWSAHGSRLPLARIRCNLLASDDEWTAPIMAEVGPDGNVWVIDWYNYIVQHNPDAARLQDRQGRGLRNAAARQDAWAHLSDRSSRTPTPATAARRLEQGHAGRTGRGAEERQHVLAAARPAAARRARASRTSCRRSWNWSRPERRCGRAQCGSDPCPLDACTAWAHLDGSTARSRQHCRLRGGALQASVLRRAPQCRAGAAADGGIAVRDSFRRDCSPTAMPRCG